MKDFRIDTKKSLSAVQRVIASAKLRGIDVDEFEAECFLKAKRILERDATNSLAREVVEHFAQHLDTGKKPESFAAFMLREDRPE